MKKHLIALSIIAITTVMSAKSMESGDRPEDDGSISSSGASSSRLLGPIDVSETLTSLAQNPQNIQHVGGWFGTTIGATPIVTQKAWKETFSTMAKGYNDALDRCAVAEQSARDLHESVQNTAAVSLALAQAQEKLEASQRAQQELEDKLLAEQALTKLFRDKEIALLSEVKAKDMATALDKKRMEVLEREKAALKEILNECEKNVTEIERLLKDTSEREASLPQQSIDSTTTKPDAKIERVRESILAIITKNREQIEALRAKNAELERSKKETEERVGQLQTAIESHDHYTIIFKMIHDRSIEDKKLGLHIFSIKNVIGKNLDELSEGRDQRLIEALILVSRPYEDRPEGDVTYDYDAKGCWRFLGNLFVEGGLSWKGAPINLKKCTYDKSKFRKNAENLAENDELMAQ